MRYYLSARNPDGRYGLIDRTTRSTLATFPNLHTAYTYVGLMNDLAEIASDVAI